MYSRYRHHHYSTSNLAADAIIIGIILFVVIGIAVGSAAIKVANPQTHLVKVQSKEVKNSNKSSKFLVFCIDPMSGESKVFEVTDSLFKGRFDSADTYNLIQEGETYEFTTGGYRIPFFSMYPNIYEIKKVDNPVKEPKITE